MGVLTRLLDWLGRGEPRPEDPDALVEIAVVPLTDGPLLVAELERAGIDAVGIDSYDVATGVLSRMRVMVRGADLAAAREIVEPGG